MDLRATIVLLFLILSFSGCRDEAVRAALVQTPPRIDGELTEWQNVPVRVFEEKNIAIGALEDTQYLYLAARCANQEVNRWLSRRGIMMWLDPDAGERKDLEVHYPASAYSTPDPTRGGFWQAMSDDQRERAFQRLEGMRNGVLVIDKRLVDSRIFAPDSPQGFAAASTESQGILTLEVRIPLDLGQFFPTYGSIAHRERVRVGLALSGTQDRGFPEGRSGDVGPGGYPGGGRMGRGSRGMYPRGQSSAGSDVWVDVMLIK